eukprot:PhF_6_TR26953/c0_g1_i1/m.39301/K10260/FBXW7, SEL10; F-box and WD-40 domain protein 7
MDPDSGAIIASTPNSHVLSTPASKKLIQMENYKKVQRRKLERKFMAEIRSNFSLDHLQQLKEEQENEVAKAPAYTPRPASPAPRSIPQRPTDTIRVVNEFSGSVRALEITQGGATLWTAEEDGTIGVRSGVTGAVVHTIAKVNEYRVSSLYATETHMWVGMSDGSVRVFDHLVYLCVHEAKFHTDAVTCFAQTFDFKVFSGSADTTIVKWDTEKRSFELMTKIIAGHTKKIRCLASYGYHLFSGSDDSVIRCVDTETGHKVQTYDGHQGPVNALLVLDGFLFSGSDDGSVRVWNIDTGECIKMMTEAASTSPVTALIADNVGHRLWSADSTGVINVWDSSVEVGFKHIQSLTDHNGTSITGMRNFCAIDATKVWSLASNGLNKVWYSATNKVEDAMQDTINAMQDILDEDVIELEKWRELIQKMSAVDARRKQELADAMSRSSDTALLRVYFLKLIRWVQVSRIRSRRSTVSKILATSCDQSLRQLYYWKLWNYAKLKRQQFLKMSMTRNLLATTEKGLINIYWKRMREFRDRMKAKENRAKMLESLLHATEKGLQHSYFRRWYKCIDVRKKRDKRQKICSGLIRGSEAGLRRVYYFKLNAFVSLMKENRRKLATCQALTSFTTRGCMLAAYCKWSRFLALQRRKAKKRVIAEALSRTLANNVMAHYYAIWMAFLKERHRNSLEQKIEQAKDKLAALSAQYKQVEHLLERQKQLDIAQAAIDAAKLEQQKKLDRIAQLNAENEELKKAIALKEHGKAETARNIAEQLDDLMARMKAKVLNFHFDYALIAQLKGQQDKVKKLFLEAHIRVKRVVVDLTKLTNPPRKWPLTTDMIHKMPSHQIKVVLRAIKEMIIAFDMMDASVRETLESDEEIVENAETLMEMADVCVEYIQKTLGKAAMRVK